MTRVTGANSSMLHVWAMVLFVTRNRALANMFYEEEIDVEAFDLMEPQHFKELGCTVAEFNLLRRSLTGVIR